MSEATGQTEVVNNETERCFEVQVDGRLAVSHYRRRGDKIFLTHTEVPPEIEGRGVANSLARAALEFARAEGLRVVPRCAFVAAFLKRHPEYQDLVDEAA